MNENGRLVLDAATLLEQIRRLGEIGSVVRGEGRTRIALTDTDKAGRDQLVQWMQALDLAVCVDRIGNIFGTMPAADHAAGKACIMVGSHIDTVANAGALDGCYGVLAGLAIARSYRAAGRLPERPLTIAAFTNEEGVRYQPDMMGSLVYAGGLNLARALDAAGTDGTRLGDELERIGYAGEIEPGAVVPHAYLELHIEQGPVLDTPNISIGVVENLQGISWQRIVVNGKANHAGTTPMHMRHDAGYAAAAIAVELRQMAMASRGTTLATAGSIRFEPDLINVIPRKALLTVDMRDPCDARLKACEVHLAAFLKDLAREQGVQIEIERLARSEPVTFDPGLVNMIERAVDSRGLSHLRMTSGAGHDAQMMARICPAAMIFVPSREGVSHNPREHTDDAQLIQGAQVLLDVVTQLLGHPDRRV